MQKVSASHRNSLPLHHWKHSTSQTKSLKSLRTIQAPAPRPLTDTLSFGFHSLASLVWYFANHKVRTKSDNMNAYVNLVESDLKEGS